MYCVKCGVKLPENTNECPLCHTVMHYEEASDTKTFSSYSDRYPREDRESHYIFLALVTTLILVISSALVILCLELYGQLRWSAYVAASLLLFWMIVIFPGWFRKLHPVIMAAADFVSIMVFLFFINAYNRQSWFWSFGFPVTLYFLLLIETAIVLFMYVRKGRLYILSGLSMGAGISCLVIEFFLHVTFRTRMFVWSLYGLLTFGLFGIFFLLAAIIKPLGDYLERKFFI